MPYVYDTHIFNGRSYMKVVDHQCIHKEQNNCIDALLDKDDSNKKVIENLNRKYETALYTLNERAQELATQNKEILALRDTIEALKFDRDVAMSKLDKTVEPTTKADKMRERVKCELCGKDLSRNSLRGHMKRMHIADGDDDVSTTCLSGVD